MLSRPSAVDTHHTVIWLGTGWGFSPEVGVRFRLQSRLDFWVPHNASVVQEFSQLSQVVSLGIRSRTG